MVRNGSLSFESVHESWISRDNINWLENALAEEAIKKETVQEVKPRAIQSIYFANLEIFINKFHFKATSLPWRLENGSYTLEQITNKDAYGFSVYRIKSKRFYDNSLFMGRLPNSKFAEEVLLAITEDYHLENVENDPPLRDNKENAEYAAGTNVSI